MPPLDTSVFQTQQAMAALENYAAVTHLAVHVYDRNEQLITAPTIDSNRLFELFAGRREPHIFSDCVKRCFANRDGSVAVLEDGHGLAVVGAPFINSGEVACVAVGGYALTGHLDQREVHRLAHDSGLSFESVWQVVRKELPIPKHRLPLYGELLRILGDTLLSEHHRALQLHETLGRLEAADRAKDEFLATLSHELRSPLNAILGWTQMLRAGGLDPATAAHALETIESNSYAQIKLINDLLDVSRIVAGKLRLEVQTVDIVPLIQRVIESFRVSADAKEIQLEASLDPAVGAVSGDADRLTQIFSNLLSNAVKFSQSRGSIKIRLERVESQARIVISDTGEGILPDFLPHIFDRFWQADNTITRSHGGLGLGLAIVRHLVELHGGTITAESKGEGRGATFTVTLPLARLPMERPKESLSSSRVEPSPLDGVRVWIVDDDATSRKVLKVFLEQHGAQVTTLSSAYEALKMIDESVPQVLVCDISMPGMDGYTLMHQIRSRDAEHGGSVPAIAQTGYATPEDRERALSSGYQVFLGKPLNLDQLLRDIASLAGSPL